MSAPTMAHPATTDTRTTPSAAADQPPAPVTIEMVVDAILREAAAAGIKCTEHEAYLLDEMIGRAVTTIRELRQKGLPALYELDETDMAAVHNSGLLDAVLPDTPPDEAPDMPRVGSVADLLGRRHLIDNETAVVHTFGERLGGRYCAVAVAVKLVDA